MHYLKWMHLLVIILISGVLRCLYTYRPATLLLTGTLNVYPDGTKQAMSVTLSNITIRERNK